MLKRLLKIIYMIIGGLCLGVIMAFLFGWIVMLLWNWLMPALFELPEVSLFEALGLLLLSGCLFGRRSSVKFES